MNIFLAPNATREGKHFRVDTLQIIEPIAIFAEGWREADPTDVWHKDNPTLIKPCVLTLSHLYVGPDSEMGFNYRIFDEVETGPEFTLDDFVYLSNQKLIRLEECK